LGGGEQLQSSRKYDTALTEILNKTNLTDDNTAIIAEVLLNNGANVEDTGFSKDSALITAAAKNYNKTVQVLIDRGANIEATSIVGNTALLTALQSRNKKTALLLIENGADISDKPDSFTPIQTLINEAKISDAELQNSQKKYIKNLALKEDITKLDITKLNKKLLNVDSETRKESIKSYLTECNKQGTTYNSEVLDAFKTDQNPTDLMELNKIIENSKKENHTFRLSSSDSEHEQLPDGPPKSSVSIISRLFGGGPARTK
jgi:Ankyrin repeats (3 copies)